MLAWVPVTHSPSGKPHYSLPLILFVPFLDHIQFSFNPFVKEEVHRQHPDQVRVSSLHHPGVLVTGEGAHG